jgi:hypothetical protein
MKPVECYQCDQCESIYPSNGEAFACEIEHVNPDNLEISMCWDYTQDGAYPTNVILTNEARSGSAAKYVKVSEGSVEDVYPEDQD